MTRAIPPPGLVRAMRSLARASLGIGESHAPSFRFYVRILGGVYAFAFLSLAFQVRGLIGSEGLLPAAEHLRHAREILGTKALLRAPGLFWFDASDFTLTAAAWLGVGIGLGVAAGLFQGPLLLLSWALYLSFVSVGQVFLNYQWDMLLLEAGFLAPWVASWRWRVHWGHGKEPSILLVWLHWWLLFRLMLSAGWVKVRIDAVWRDLTALDYHFWTQPLPTWTAWWAHQTPEIVRQAATAGALAVELGGPWLILLGRPGRCVAFAMLGGLQLLIAATGNYGFFNLLTFALCVPLLGRSAERRDGSAVDPGFAETPGVGTPVGSTGLDDRVRQASVFGLALLVLLLSLVAMARLESRGIIPPYPLDALERELAGFRVVNGYGLFADMTEVRPEIIVEVSDDGATWRAIEFPWKPGEPARPPRYAGFHMPRLDWQMWFEGLNFLAQEQVYEARRIERQNREYYPSRWFQMLMIRLLEPSNPAASLAASHTVERPTRIRALVYQYRFTSRAEQRATGRWWERERVGVYLPSVGLNPRAAAGGPS